MEKKKRTKLYNDRKKSYGTTNKPKNQKRKLQTSTVGKKDKRDSDSLSAITISFTQTTNIIYLWQLDYFCDEFLLSRDRVFHRLEYLRRFWIVEVESAKIALRLRGERRPFLVLAAPLRPRISSRGCVEKTVRSRFMNGTSRIGSRLLLWSRCFAFEWSARTEKKKAKKSFCAFFFLSFDLK